MGPEPAGAVVGARRCCWVAVGWGTRVRAGQGGSAAERDMVRTAQTTSMALLSAGALSTEMWVGEL